MSIRRKSFWRGSASRCRRAAFAYSPEQAVYRATQIGGGHWVVKAQIHSGARGKAGGVKLCTTPSRRSSSRRRTARQEARDAPDRAGGQARHRLYVEAATVSSASSISGFVLDRKCERIMVVASRQGGMEIEEIVATTRPRP